MKRKFLTLVLLMFAVSAFAQQESKRGPFLTNGFWDNWFISAGGGASIYYGEWDNKIAIGERITPAIDLSIGKWVTPTVGFRLQYAGLSAKGSVYGNALFSATGDHTNTWNMEKFNVMNLHFDGLWNLSNFIGGYRSDRVWDLVPFAGFGWGRATNVNSWNTTKVANNEFVVNAGLVNNFRISEALDIKLEYRHMFVNQVFDGVALGARLESMASLTLGLTYKFQRRDFEKYVKVEPADYTPYNSRIADLEKQIATKDANTRSLSDQLAVEKNKKPIIVESKTEYIVSPLAVFFQIGKADLTDKEIINLGYCADIIKKSGKKFRISGSADHQTGTKKFNQEISEKRAQRVLDVLVNKFGVDPGKLEIIAKGDENEPYDKAILNRVVIVEN
ncbi:MAG: OmpA family protein [uncultured bacterium]|nr:MAG: OmpA family protein [uncultured bacterium]